MAGLGRAFEAASTSNIGKQYPYIFIDQSQKGQMTRFRLFTDIYSRFKQCFSVDGMRAVVIGAQDFERFYDLFRNGNEFTAKEREPGDKTSEISEREEGCEVKTDNIKKTADPTERKRAVKQRKNAGKNRAEKRRKIFGGDLYKD